MLKNAASLCVKPMESHHCFLENGTCADHSVHLLGLLLHVLIQASRNFTVLKSVF